MLQVSKPVLHAGASRRKAGPSWGCGLVGVTSGIARDGTAAPETQRLIDGIKGSSSFKKVSYWNWKFASEALAGAPQQLTSDFIFMPELRGVGPADPYSLLHAGEANFRDLAGRPCPAEMATILLGMNEPDIAGSRMGNMFGKCTAPCSQAALDARDCPAARLDPAAPPAEPNGSGECNCWEFSHTTGVGFWPVAGCAVPQPLPSLWEVPQLAGRCVAAVLDAWRATALAARLKGYRYLSTPQVAENIGYARKFIEAACGCDAAHRCACTDASCGCPTYVAFRFYGRDCQPKKNGDYDTFGQRLRDVASIMEEYPFVNGAIINEVGMLNCAGGNASCVPNSGKYPASQQRDGGCPNSDELPNGLATFLETILDMAARARTRDGRAVTKGFTWFNKDQDGGTYDLSLLDRAGTVNKLGEAYIRGCTKWGRMSAIVQA